MEPLCRNGLSWTSVSHVGWDAGSERGATTLLLSKPPGAKLNFALKATMNINGPVFSFVTDHQNHLAILTFALCYVCWPIKISSGVSRAWNAVILSKLRLVCPNCAANTPMSCGIIKMARWTLNWRAIKYATWFKYQNITLCLFIGFIVISITEMPYS